MKLYRGNQIVFHIVSNPMLREPNTKTNCHFIREKLLSKELSIGVTNNNNDRCENIL